METLISQRKPPLFCSSSPLLHQKFGNIPLTSSLSFKLREKPKPNLNVPGLCWDKKLNPGVPAAIARSRFEEDLEGCEGITEDWIVEMGKVREGCEGRKDLVELLECLEREAIMGEDEGREPDDYNRRAQIFDKSSKVFRALENTSSSSSSSS